MISPIATANIEAIKTAPAAISFTRSAIFLYSMVTISIISSKAVFITSRQRTIQIMSRINNHSVDEI